MNTIHKIKSNPIALFLLPQVARFIAQYGAEFFRKRRENRYRDMAIRYKELEKEEPEPRVIIKRRNPILFTIVGIVMGMAAGIGLSHLLPTRE